MRILLVNKFHWNKGGSETYYFELGKLLKKYGHEVAYFSMYDEKNIKTGDKEYFVEKIDTNSKNLLKAFSTIYSKKNKDKMKETLEDFRPDIVHINLFQRHLTYSIVEAIKEKNIPIVFTAHDLQAVCPASAMFCHGKICEKCLKDSKINCFKNKCIKQSILKSLLGSIEGMIYKNKKIYNKIDAIIAPSIFVGNKLKDDGILTKIFIIYNFVDIENFNNKNNSDEKYIFYFGRLSEEKGILNLLMAFSNQKEGKLLIAGDGPEKEKIIKYINKNKLNNRIKLLGFLNQKEIKDYIKKSSFVVVPSIWYENCPYSILETLAIGKPVIGSNIGGIPELIQNGENGYLYNFDDVERLSSLINKLLKSEEIRNKFGSYSRKVAEEKYNVEKYYNEIMQVYNKLLEEKYANKINE